jgi:acetyl-CoA carboxylase carboxyl transferase subunit alpha
MKNKASALFDPTITQEEIWKAVERSRHPQRPYSLDYISEIFSDFEELKGDRSFSDDPSLIAGAGKLKGIGAQKKELPVFFLGHQKGRNTKEKILRNFGMAKPEGYRKACRIFEMAEKFNRPLLTFIDTPGAYPGVGAEQRGQSEAIGFSIGKMLECKVPTVSVVIGEGGSGGALAIGVADALLMLENSTYSVISPESCAAILWSTAAEAKKAAHSLKPRAEDVFKLGLCDEVIKEKGDGAHENVAATAKVLLERTRAHFARLKKMPAKTRLEKRFDKYRIFDEGFLKLS